MGLILQEMSARLGLVTGRDLAQTVRAEYPRWLCYVIYVQMELAVIAADIQEVVGTAIAINLLSGGRVPVWGGCLVTACDTLTFLAVQYFGVRYLEGVICLLIATMTICFFVNWGAAHTDAGELFTGWVVPELPGYGVMQAVGTIGAVIMPHNLYLHSGLVLSRKLERSSPHRANDAIQYARIESAVALLVSFFINLAVVATNADRFFSPQCAEMEKGPFACIDTGTAASSGGGGGAAGGGAACYINRTGAAGTCGELGLSSEGHALSSALGESALYIWALGLFAAGQAATMVCTYAGQIIMGGCLELQIAPWKRVAFTRVFALGPALAVALGTHPPSQLFNNINEYLNVAQSVQLPFAMLPVLHFTASRRLLGRFRSGIAMMALSVVLALLVITANVVLVVQLVDGFPLGAVVAVALYSIVYSIVCIRMVSDDIRTLFIMCCRCYAGEDTARETLRESSNSLPKINAVPGTL